MGITLPIFKSIPVESGKLQIVARCLDIWSWTRCTILVGMLLEPEDVLILSHDTILKISSLFATVVMKESLLFVDKKNSKVSVWKSYFWLDSLRNWFENVTESICDLDFFFVFVFFFLFFCFIDFRDLTPIQVFLMSLMLSLKDLMKYFSFAHLRSVDKGFL